MFSLFVPFCFSFVNNNGIFMNMQFVVSFLIAVLSILFLLPFTIPLTVCTNLVDMRAI